MKEMQTLFVNEKVRSQLSHAPYPGSVGPMFTVYLKVDSAAPS